MDHHCPWVNNCVSFSNYKFFILTLVYTLLLTLYIIATSLQYVILFWINWGDPGQSMQELHIVFLCICGVVFFIAVCSLLCFHLQLLYYNKTTLESLRTPIFQSGMDPDKFNVGPYVNFTQVFGRNKLMWFLPVFSGLGDGVHFPLRNDERINQSLNTSNNNLRPIMSMKTVHVQPINQRSLDIAQSLGNNDDERKRILAGEQHTDEEEDIEEISEPENGTSNVSLVR